MTTDNRTAIVRGWLFLSGGIGLGLLLVLALLTHGFGLAGAQSKPAAEAPLLIHQGGKIIVPEGSALRDRLLVMAAPSEPVNPKLSLPAVVEADPARTAAVLSPLGGRVLQLKVALGDRVSRLSDAHALEFFKNEGVAPDAQQRIAKFFKKGQQTN